MRDLFLCHYESLISIIFIVAMMIFCVLLKFYEKNEKMLPGKKGISLTVDQYKVIRDAVKSGQFDEIIRLEGGDV